jgi:sensor c-di-GMP phosphodiesterase-like protein
MEPDVFIAVAEASGVIIPITKWLLLKVRNDLMPYFHDRRDFHIGINLVAEHFQDGAIMEDIEKALAGSGFTPSALLLEATERQIINDNAEHVMAALRALGCKIALDDFGIGHSGLAYLGKLPVDYLKIDKAFVSTIGTDAINRPVLDAIIDLGHKLGIGLIAEGVDKAQQCEYLRAHGVHLAQGYYFSKPLILPELIDFVSELKPGRTAASRSDPMILNG